MQEASDDLAAVYAAHTQALRAGQPSAVAPGLPDADRAFLRALHGALGDGDGLAPWLAGSEALTGRELALAQRSRYARCAAQLAGDDRRYLVQSLSLRLAERLPAIDAAGPHALVLQRYLESPELAPEDRARAALLAVLSAPATRPRATGPLPAPAAAERTVWVNGQEVRLSKRDDALLNAAVAATVGLVAFGLLFGKLINWLPPTSSVLVPAIIAMAIASTLAGLGWVGLGKLPPDFRRQVRRIVEDVVPYYKLFGACVIGLGMGLWLIVSGEFGFGVLTLSFSALVIWGYMRFR